MLIELVIIAAAAMVLLHGYQLAQVSSNTRMVSVNWSMRYLYWAVPVGCGLVIFFTLVRMVHMWKRLRGNADAAQVGRP